MIVGGMAQSEFENPRRNLGVWDEHMIADYGSGHYLSSYTSTDLKNEYILFYQVRTFSLPHNCSFDFKLSFTIEQVGFNYYYDVTVIRYLYGYVVRSLNFRSRQVGGDRGQCLGIRQFGDRVILVWGYYKFFKWYLYVTILDLNLDVKKMVQLGENYEAYSIHSADGFSFIDFLQIVKWNERLTVGFYQNGYGNVSLLFN